MNRSFVIRWVLRCIACAPLLAAPTAVGEPMAPGSSRQAVGTWSVVSQYVEQDGKRIEPFGANPKGMVVYDAGGRFMLILHRADLPRFASNNRMTGTAEENKAIAQGSIAYFGTYAIDESDGTIVLRYEGSTYPNWQGDTQKRLVSVSGDDLQIVSPFTSVGGGKAYLTLRRMK